MPFLTSSIRLPGFSVGNENIDLYGLEPQNVSNFAASNIPKMPFVEYIAIENEPELYKKRYFKGCLENNKKAKIIVCRHGGIGDIQWVIPSLREIKKRYPEVQIKMSVMEKDREMIANCDFIDGFCQTHFPTIKDLIWCDFVLDFFDTVEGIGEDEAKHRNPIDISADIVGLKLSDYMGFWKVEPDEKLWAESIFAGRKSLKIAMPLGSSSPHRSWSLQDELIMKLVEWKNDIIILITGEGAGHSEAVYNRIKEMKLPNVIDMVRKTTTRQCMNLALECDLTISNDSGAINILGSLGKKAIGFYSTVPKETRINHYPAIEGIQVKDKCSPCYKLNHVCEFKDKCLFSIKSNEVFKKIISMIGG